MTNASELPPKMQAIRLAGYRARFRGYFVGDCPYDYDDILAAVWADAWMAANERIVHAVKQERSEPNEAP